MNFRLLGWLGFVFGAGGLLLYIFGPPEWRPFGCGAMLTALTLYGVGLFLILRMIRRTKKGVEEMMRRVMEQTNRRKGGSRDDETNPGGP
jgi:hypothetical protein